MTDIKNKFFYLHVPKTAGTSMNTLIASHFPRQKVVLHVESKPEWYDRDKHEYFASKDFISGHISLKQFAERFIAGEYFKFATFRRPIDHIISHLAWARHLCEPGKEQFLLGHPAWVQELSRKLSEIELSDPEQVGRFILNMGDRESSLFDNSQSRYLVRIPGSVKVQDSHLAAALKELETLNFVGLSEHLDETVIVLCHLMGWKLPQVVHTQNITNNKYGMIKKDVLLRQALQPAIWADNSVYKKAAKIFWTALNSQLLGLSRDSDTFSTDLSSDSFFREVSNSITGYFDVLEPKRIKGWAFYRLRPEIPAYLKVCLPTKSILIKAVTFRRNILEKGLHPTGNCGFILDIPDDIIIMPGDRVDIIAVGSGRRLRCSPRTLDDNSTTCAAPKSLQPIVETK